MLLTGTNSSHAVGWTLKKALLSCEGVMIASLSAVTVVFGAIIAFTANRYPGRRQIMETLAGVLLIAGLVMIGFALERVFGAPW